MRLNGLQKAPLMGAFLFVFLAASSWAGSPKLVEVNKVIDGDSLRLSNGQQVRLIGVNTPEMVGKDKQPEPFAITARDTLKRLIGSTQIRLTSDYEKRDRHRRLLAYVETVDGRDVQERLLSEGMGFLVAIPPNLSRLNRYQVAQQHARSSGRGVWGEAAFAPIPADQIENNNTATGFKQVRGTVKSFYASRRNYYFRMSKNFQIKIPRANWVYFQMKPKSLLKKEITVRGWVTRGKYRLQMRVPHPAMVDF